MRGFVIRGKLFVFCLFLLFVLTSCGIGNRLIVSVRLEASVSKGIENNYIQSKMQLDADGYVIYYDAVSRDGNPYAYGETHGSYQRLDTSDSLYLSQGLWEIFVACVPRTSSPMPDHISFPLDGNYLAGTSGNVYINLNTDVINVYIDNYSTMGAAPGVLTIDSYRVLKSGLPDGSTISYTLSLLTGGNWEPVEGLDSNPQTNDHDGYTEFRDRVNLAPGLYTMKIDAKKDTYGLFSSFIGFAIRPGFETVVSGVCDTLNQPPATEWKPLPEMYDTDPEHPELPPSDIIKVAGTNPDVENFLTKPIEGNKIYQINSGDLNPSHTQRTEDRILLGDHVTHFAIDLNGNPLPVNKGNGGRDDECMTVITVKDNQSFTLFNFKDNTTSSFFGNTWNSSYIRYDSTIKVHGGNFYCAPDDLNRGTVKIYGPSKDSGSNSSTGSHQKQGVISIEGKGGTILLESSHTSLEGVKGISSYNHENATGNCSLVNTGTALESSSRVDIEMRGGASIIARGDRDNDNKQNGSESAVGIYLECGSRTGEKTNATIDLLLDASSIDAECYGQGADFNAAGIVVRNTTGRVAVTLTNNANIRCVSQYPSNLSSPTGYGMYFEGISGDIVVTIDNGAGFDFSQPTVGIKFKDCTGKIELNLNGKPITGTNYGLIFENCYGDGKSISIIASGTSDPISCTLNGSTADMLVSGNHSSMNINGLNVNANSGAGTYQIENGQARRLT